MALLLTPEELAELTDYVTPSKQIAWLRQHGFRFEVGASGRPKVLTAELEHRMLSRRTPSEPQATAPDFSWMQEKSD